jgi:hypothetical protein
MAGKRRSPLDRYTVCEQYISTRARAFTFTATDIKKMMKPEAQVYGVIADIPMGPNLLATLVCYVNGAANLYFNMGGSVSGMSMKYRPVAHAARTLVLSSEQCLPICEKTTSYDLPMGRDHHVYLLTKKGLYKTVITPTAVNENDRMRKLLFYLYQNVMAEIRTAQMKEASNKKTDKEDSDN